MQNSVAIPILTEAGQVDATENEDLKVGKGAEEERTIYTGSADRGHAR